MSGANDPSQVLDVIRDVLLQHMDAADGLPEYRVQSAVYVGFSGRLLSAQDLIAGADELAGLRLTMRDGAEFNLSLAVAS